MKQIILILAALAFSLSGFLGQQAFAQRAVPIGEDPVITIDAAPDASEAISLIDVIVEGDLISLRARNVGSEDMEVLADPIFERLNSRFEARGSILGYWRFQDGAVMGLDFSDGKVRANGAVLGKLPDFQTRDDADTWLSLNAISVLTGTLVTGDLATGFVFTLDERLKPQYDLELWINDTPVDVVPGQEPRTIGPILLVPLRTVVAALGHTLEEDPVAGTITVNRIHDSAVISLELATGLVTINGVPSGISPNISYAEPGTLILPSSSVETLTGTHVKLVPGSNRVDVSLDDRLSSLALPGESVIDEAANTNFVAEKLDYQISDRGPITLELSSRFGEFNSQSTFETAGGLDNPAGYVPRWVSMDVQSLDGWRGTVGDYNGGFREFSGTSVSRIRGGAFRNMLDDDTIMAIAAGVPVTGAKQIDDDVNVPTFSGVAAGVRFIETDGEEEWGVSLAMSDGGERGRIVIGGRQQIEIENEDGVGLESAFVSGEVGGFIENGNTLLDLRGRAEGRYRIDAQTTVRATASYDGAEFQKNHTQEIDETEEQTINTAARTVGALALDWHAAEQGKFLRNLAGGIRGSVTYLDAPQISVATNLNGAASARLGSVGPDVSIDLGVARTETDIETITSHSLAMRAFKAFEWGSLTGAYTRQENDLGEITERMVVNTSLPPWRKRFDKGANLSIGPSANFTWDPDTTTANLGASMVANSGQLLGERLDVQGQFSALTSANPNAASTSVFANVNAIYRLAQNAQLKVGYATDFDNRSDLTVALRGSILFNEPRKHTRPKDGTGVLKGRVFFDRNRDGIRQEDEPGIPGVRLKVIGTRLGLAVDNMGSYTIQNMKTGLYSLNIDRRSLPLGLLIDEAHEPRATVGDGRVTTLDIPVIASGQIRGTVYVDLNENGALDKGEHRLEGQWVRLTPHEGEEHLSTQSASFGQYGFESVTPGEYTISVNIGGQRVREEIEITDENLFLEINIPVPMSAMARMTPASNGVLGAP